eukprot:scaffold735_cov255-Pinguiococcus_pyrenoidosus.AAC.16
MPEPRGALSSRSSVTSRQASLGRGPKAQGEKDHHRITGLLYSVRFAYRGDAEPGFPQSSSADVDLYSRHTKMLAFESAFPANAFPRYQPIDTYLLFPHTLHLEAGNGKTPASIPTPSWKGMLCRTRRATMSLPVQSSARVLPSMVPEEPAICRSEDSSAGAHGDMKSSRTPSGA